MQTSMKNGILPTVDYPPMIRGSLRLILQVKDAFLACFNLIEEYRSQLLLCQRCFARELVVHKLTQGLVSIKRLREDLADIETRAQARYQRNMALRQYLMDNYAVVPMNDPSTSCSGIVSRLDQDGERPTNRSGTRNAAVSSELPAPVSAPDSVEAALHGGWEVYSGSIDVDLVQVPDEIDLAKSTTDGGNPLLPVVEFYRGFYFLQMHFQIIMCQAANFAMPVVTRQIGLAERAFSWPTMPAFGLSSSSGSMRDRLLEIHTDVLGLAQRLQGCLEIVQEKSTQDRRIESYYKQHTAAQENLCKLVLRCLQAQRVYIDCLESQNDKLAGLAIKLNPGFAKTREFLLMTGSDFPLKTNSDDGNQNSTKVKNVFNLSSKGSTHSDRKSDEYPNGGSSNADVQGYRSEHSSSTNRGSGGQKYNDPDSSKPSSGSHNNTRSNSDIEMPVSDVNFSASGGGYPIIWRQMNSKNFLPSSEQDNGRMFSQNAEAAGRTNSMPGSLKMVSTLLLGVDTVAPGRGKEVPSAVIPHSFPSSGSQDSIDLNQKIVTQGTERVSVNGSHGSFKGDTPLDSPRFSSSSNRYSQVESLSPAISVKRQATMVSGSNSETVMKDSIVKFPLIHTCSVQGTKPKQASENRSDDTEGDATTEETVSISTAGQCSHKYMVDTNVNASGVLLPEICVQKQAYITSSNSGYLLSKPSTVQTRVASNDTGLSEKVGQFNVFEDNIMEVQKHPQRLSTMLVPQVSSGKCGTMWVPDWISGRCSKRNNVEDLLEEPKRSAINRALLTHRSRLVETILKADEEKLEELIALLLRG